jgi:hypothetical protein
VNIERITFDLVFVFISYAVVATTFHYARKSGRSSIQRRSEASHSPGIFYWYFEPIRAYIRGLLEVGVVGLVWSIILGFPVIFAFGFRWERIVVAILTFLLTALVGIWAGRADR